MVTSRLRMACASAVAAASLTTSSDSSALHVADRDQLFRQAGICLPKNLFLLSPKVGKDACTSVASGSRPANRRKRKANLFRGVGTAFPSAVCCARTLAASTNWVSFKKRLQRLLRGAGRRPSQHANFARRRIECAVMSGIGADCA